MSKIEWTDQTWNPTTGCTKVSPGCDHCYMFAMYPRLKAMGTKGYEASPDVVRLQSHRVSEPYDWRKPRRVFVNSMSDLFHNDISDIWRDEIFKVMANCPQHQFQILTKRPQRARAWWESAPDRFRPTGMGSDYPPTGERCWPVNVWIGVSIESQDYDWRIDALAELPAKVRFISAEPLLGPLPGLTEYMLAGLDDQEAAINWVIAGGESGRDARPADLDWFRDIRADCAYAQVPFFLKQLGGYPDKRGGNKALLDGELYREFPDAG